MMKGVIEQTEVGCKIVIWQFVKCVFRQKLAVKLLSGNLLNVFSFAAFFLVLQSQGRRILGSRHILLLLLYSAHQ